MGIYSNYLFIQQNPDQAHLFESIYWEQYKKAMALTGVVPQPPFPAIPPQQQQQQQQLGPPPAAATAINMTMDTQPVPVIPPPPPMESVAMEGKSVDAFQIPNGGAEERQPEGEIKEEIKDELMEVDELKVEVDTNGNSSSEVSDQKESLESQSNTMDLKSSPEEETISTEQQQQQRQKNNLMENEGNDESRCSSSSTDDMWRPW